MGRTAGDAGQARRGSRQERQQVKGAESEGQSRRGRVQANRAADEGGQQAKGGAAAASSRNERTQTLRRSRATLGADCRRCWVLRAAQTACQGHDREHIECSPCSAHLSIAHRRLQSPLRLLPRDVLLRSCIHHPGSPHPLPCSVAFTHNLHGAHLTRAVLPALNTLATVPSPPLPLRPLHSHHPQPPPPPPYALSHTISCASTPAIP